MGRNKKRKKRRKKGRRSKQMNRPARLKSAKSWVESNRGPKLLRRYRKHYGVDVRCAVVELGMLGVLNEARVAELLRQADDRARARDERRAARARKRDANAHGGYGVDWDDTFSFIAGFTAGGVPYGTPWPTFDDLPIPEPSVDAPPATLEWLTANEGEVHGITLKSDSRGWTVTAEVQSLADQELLFERGAHFWVRCSMHDGLFEGVGGPGSLMEILSILRGWAS